MIDIKDMFKNKFNNESLEETIDKLLLNDSIRNFIYQNDISKEIVTLSMTQLLDYKEDEVITSNGIRSKRYKDYMPILVLRGNRIVVEYKRVTINLSEKINAFNMPSSTGNETLEDFNLSTDERKKAYQYARRFINSFKTDNEIKGLYISGDFRSGKTYLSLAIAREIAIKGYRVSEIYYPELSVLLKSSMHNETDDSYFDLIENLKNTDLLILDDFGGEAINPFIRDEALGVILNYRMNKKKPVLITSNVPICKLADTTLRKDGSEGEMIKALRIVERIKELTEEFHITGRFKERKAESYEN